MSNNVNSLEHLIVQGVQYETTLSKKYKNRKPWKLPNLNMINSFIPGTVIDVLVKPGQKVKQGETLMILDAMKMYNNVLMPFDGEVIKINVEPNDRVVKNQAMIEIRPK
jgi:biotin carboxyl carrier protein